MGNYNDNFRSVDPSTYHSVNTTKIGPKFPFFPKPTATEERELKFLVTNTKTSFLEVYLKAFVSACNAELFCYPLNHYKKRSPIQSEMLSNSNLPQKYRRMLANLLGILKEEGFLKLYGGISAMVMRHSKMFFYDFFRDRMITKDSNDKPQLSFCGVISSPTDLIKVQMQMKGQRRLMREPQKIHNIFQALTTIYNTGGIVGLWKSAMPSTWRAVIVTLGDFSFYELSKRKLMVILNQPNNLFVQLLGAMIAGFAGAVLSTPADVVKSRIRNQPGLYYKGTMECFSKLVKDEGIFAMYKGFLPYWLRMGTFSIIFWMTFEQMRRFCGDQNY